MSRALAVAIAGLSTLARAGPPAPPKTPVPTEAQCIALGPPGSPIPFGPGETLEYDIDALGAKAGKMTMRVEPSRDGSLPVEVSVETNTFFSKVRRVKGSGTSYLNPRTLRPTRYHEDAKENEIHRVADVTFKKDKTARLVSTINGQTGTAELRYGNDITDVAGAVFLLRSLPLKEGMSVCVDIYGIRTIWRVWGKVLPKEHVSLPVGEFEAFHLEAEAARLDLPDARRGVHVWISDDARRLPLAAVGVIDLGTVRATLTGFSRPGDKSAKAEHKGNLKW
jgi:hypothetical protein